MSACTSTAWDTSVLTKMASPPFSVIIWTVCCPPSSFISATTSFAPSRANVRAVARPIPEAPPVTNATLPSTRPAMSRPPVPHVPIATLLVEILHDVSVYRIPQPYAVWMVSIFLVHCDMQASPLHPALRYYYVEPKPCPLRGSTIPQSREFQKRWDARPDPRFCVSTLVHAIIIEV